MKINLDLLKDYKSDFDNEKSNFNLSSYGTFSSGYINKCSDAYIIRMRNELKKLYQNIEKSYKNINSWWENYNNDIESMERALSNEGRSGAIRTSSVRSCINALPTLKPYSLDFSGIINLNFENGIQTFDLEAENISFTNSNISSNNANSNFDSSLFDEINWGNDLFDFFSNTGAVISESWDFIKDSASEGWKYISDFCYNCYYWLNDVNNTVNEVIDRTGATIVVGAQSVIEGILQFGEAIVDFGVLVKTVEASFLPVLIDSGQAIYGAITGKEWTSLTKQLWEGTMGFVSNQYVSGWFDLLYQNTGYGQRLAEQAYAFDTFRSIGSGVGYTVGVVALTIATLGTGSVVAAGGSVTATAATATTQMAITATAAGIGKGTEAAWADGADLLEGLATGALTGLWEGVQWWIGGKIGSMTPLKNGKISSKVLNSLLRIGADALDGGIEGFIQPFISSIYQDGYYDEKGNYIEFTENDDFRKKYTELFDDAGGWANVGIQTLIGGGSSLIGEAFDLSKALRQTSDVKVEAPHYLDNGFEVAEYFNDPKQYLFQKLKFLAQTSDDASFSEKYVELGAIDPRTINEPAFRKKGGQQLATVDISENDLFDFLNNKGVLTEQDYEIYTKLKNGEIKFSQIEKDAIFIFTAWFGPKLAAYNRNAVTNFSGARIDGTNYFQIESGLNWHIDLYNRVYGKNIPHMHLQEFNSIMDKITQRSVLKEDLVVYRGANSLFEDGIELEPESLKPGQIFNDKAHISTSVIQTKMVEKHKYILEIKLPKDTPYGYIETVTGVGRYNQQELLLGRNNNFKITEYPEVIVIDGVEHYKVKAELVLPVSKPDLNITVELEPPTNITVELDQPDLNVTVELDSSTTITADLDQPALDATVELEKPLIEFSQYAKMYNVTEGFNGNELKQTMQKKNLMGKYDSAVNDMHIRKLYDNVTLGEHDYTHVRMVLLNAIYMGNELGLSPENLDILIESAKYHDAGLKIEHRHNGHALNSVKVAEQNLQGIYSTTALAKIKSIIEYHDGVETKERFIEICNKNGLFDSNEIDEIFKMANILRDADGMDYARFPGMLNTNLYRNKELANKLTPALFDLREEAAVEELSFWLSDLKNKMDHGNLAGQDKKVYQDVFDEIINLQNSGKYPQFLINFSRKYYDNLNFTSITECIEAICKNNGRWFKKT